MKKIKLYRKIILIQAGVLATQLLHIKVTNLRGYKAIGGEVLVVPLVAAMYVMGQAISDRWEATNKHFKQKEQLKVWKEESRRDYAN